MGRPLPVSSAWQQLPLSSYRLASRHVGDNRYGCIPVAATDFLYEAFEPELDWGHFGVKVAQKDIPKLGQLLEGFSEEQLRVKQVRGQCSVQSRFLVGP